MVQLLAERSTTTTLIVYLQANEGGSGIPWWVWLALVSVLLLLVLVGFERQAKPDESLPRPEEHAPDPIVAAYQAGDAVASEAGLRDEPKAEVGIVDSTQESGQIDAATVPTDDLKRIAGIGPKIATVLNENGISTFVALAATDTEGLQTILDNANIRLADPGTWPEQARLAAAGQWADLEALQSSLKGGRKE